MNDDKRENDQKRVEAQMNLILRAIEQENSLFVNIGSLAIALIVILSLNQNLVHFSANEGRFLLSVQIVITIIPIISHAYALHAAKKKGLEIVNKIIGRDTTKELHVSRIQQLLGYIPWTTLSAFCVTLIYILYVLWR